jgi:hypothetical protein
MSLPLMLAQVGVAASGGDPGAVSLTYVHPLDQRMHAKLVANGSVVTGPSVEGSCLYVASPQTRFTVGMSVGGQGVSLKLKCVGGWV